MSQPHETIVHGVSLLLVALLLAGCRSAGIGGVEQQTMPTVGGQQPGFGDFLPGPRTLLESRAQDRSASFSEEDYIKHGAEFIGSLPNRNALLAPSEEVQFMPQWSETEGLDPSGLAFCIYEYQIDGFDRNAELRCGWRQEPADHRAVWFGLSDWDADGWHWLRGEEDGAVGFGTAEPFFDGAWMLYVVVVVADDDDCILRYLRVGEPPPALKDLTVTPRYTRPPASVTADASGCSVPVGTVLSYEWDWDDDGDFEESTGTDAHSAHLFDTAGDYPFSVQLTSSYGETNEASDTAHIVPPWTHSWGTDLYQDITGIVTDGSQYCYSAGSTMRSTGDRDALLLKHNLGGGLEWAMAWGGGDDESLTDIERRFGSLFTVGVTKSYGAGEEDVLIVRWNEDGSIYWSAVWGTPGLDRGEGIALTDTAVYVVGSTMAMGNRDVLLLKYDLSGNFVWARTWGNSAFDMGADIDSSFQVLFEEWYLYATGGTFSPNPLYEDVLYLRFDEEAAFPTQRAWHSATDTDQYGSALTVDGLALKEVFITGSIGESGDRKALLLQAGSGSDGTAVAWAHSDECVGYEIVRLGSGLYLSGRAWELGVSSMGFVTEYVIAGPPHRYADWADGDQNTGFAAMCSFPGNSLLVAGSCRAANLGSWAEGIDSQMGYGGTWSDYSATVNVPMESTEAPTAESEELSGGVIDTGGGDWDALLSIVQFP